MFYLILFDRKTKVIITLEDNLYEKQVSMMFIFGSSLSTSYKFAFNQSVKNRPWNDILKNLNFIFKIKHSMHNCIQQLHYVWVHAHLCLYFRNLSPHRTEEEQQGAQTVETSHQMYHVLFVWSTFGYVRLVCGTWWCSDRQAAHLFCWYFLSFWSFYVVKR